MARRWPTIEQRLVDRWSALALLSPTRHGARHSTLRDEWPSSLPTVVGFTDRVEAESLVDGVDSVTEAADALWDDPAACVAEIAAVADHTGRP